MSSRAPPDHVIVYASRRDADGGWAGDETMGDRTDGREREADRELPKKLQTKLGIVRALDAYMDDTPWDKLRVVELCRRADVSRSTFYEYFQDIPDVGTWMWDYLMSDTLYQAGRRYGCFESHLRKFKALLAYRHFFMCAFKSTSYESITQHGGREMQRTYTEVLQTKMGHELSRAQSLELEFFVTGAKHMTRHWIEHGMVDSPELMAHVFVGAMPRFALPYLEPDPRYVRPDEENESGASCSACASDDETDDDEGRDRRDDHVLSRV